jgi:rfaE bifunctional protein nucleotidyltransferase chain/domain
VLANGCFDVLHYGHLEHLKAARDMGDWLTVSLTADECVNKGPGRPVNTWHHRAALLRALRCVDEVVWTSNAVDAIRIVKPAIFVKGIDYAGGGRFTEDVMDACKVVGAELRYTNTEKMSVKDIIRKAAA